MKLNENLKKIKVFYKGYFYLVSSFFIINYFLTKNNFTKEYLFELLIINIILILFFYIILLIYNHVENRIYKNVNKKIENLILEYSDIGSYKSKKEILHFENLKNDLESILDNYKYYDHLTNLKNKASIYKKYLCKENGNIICKSNCQSCPCDSINEFYLIKINNINSINDNLGHIIGDRVLKKISDVLRNYFKNLNVEIYKFSGNKFVIISLEEDSLNPKEIINLFRQPFKIEEHILSIVINIGIFTNKNNQLNIIEILKNSDIAVNFLKKHSNSNYIFFNNDMLKNIKNRFKLENDLKIAIAEAQFILYYQPKYNCKTNQILGFEALVRWNHPKRGIISPKEFIDVAETSGDIVALGEWIFKEAVLFIKKINEKSEEKYHISINISIIQLMQENFIDYIKNLLEKNGVDSKFISVEVTESIFIESYENITNKLIYLRSIGIKIDLDDFGTGYSSLSHLSNLPIDTLKIDKSFIDKIFDNRNFIEEIITIGKKLNLEIIAEGVEKIEQVVFLRNLDCDIVQGYYLSRPLPEDELFKILKVSQ